jgi:hypothetical protein
MQTFISIMRKEALIADDMDPTDQNSEDAGHIFSKKMT